MASGVGLLLAVHLVAYWLTGSADKALGCVCLTLAFMPARIDPAFFMVEWWNK